MSFFGDTCQNNFDFSFRAEMILTECPPQLILSSCGHLGSGNTLAAGREASTAARRQLSALGGSHHLVEMEVPSTNCPSTSCCIMCLQPPCLSPCEPFMKIKCRSVGTLASSDEEFSCAPSTVLSQPFSVGHARWWGLQCKTAVWRPWVVQGPFIFTVHRFYWQWEFQHKDGKWG